MSEDQNDMEKGYHLEENQIAEFKVPCPHCKSEIRVLVYEPQQLSFMFEEVIKCECGGKSAIKWDYGKQTILGIAKVDFKETRIQFHKVHEIRELTDEEVEAIQAQAQAEIKEAQAKGVTCFDNPYDHELEEEKYCIYHDVIMDVVKEINPVFAVKVLDPHGRVTEVEDKQQIFMDEWPMGEMPDHIRNVAQGERKTVAIAVKSDPGKIMEGDAAAVLQNVSTEIPMKDSAGD